MNKLPGISFTVKAVSAALGAVFMFAAWFANAAAFVLLGLGAVVAETGDYQINAGDTLEALVWNEETLSRQVRVRPDGFISMPLASRPPRWPSLAA